MVMVVHHLGGVIPTRSCIEEVFLIELRESRLGVATYMTCQLKWSYVDRVFKLGEVELIGR